VTLAAGLSLLIAETLAGVAMAQLVRPGAPCILGCFFNGVDMRSGGPSLGLPESVLTTLAGAQIAPR
jgi:trimethylamine--corrinoid protein Co-methyltransferase